MAKTFRIVRITELVKTRKKTSIGKRPGLSTMNKSKKRSHKPSRGQG